MPKPKRYNVVISVMVTHDEVSGLTLPEVQQALQDRVGAFLYPVGMSVDLVAAHTPQLIHPYGCSQGSRE
jgi:hypothetical protein